MNGANFASTPEGPPEGPRKAVAATAAPPASGSRGAFYAVRGATSMSAWTVAAALVALALAWSSPWLRRAEARRAPSRIRIVPGRFIAYPEKSEGAPAVVPWNAWRFEAPNLEAAAVHVRDQRLPPGVLQMPVRVEAVVRRPWYAFVPWHRPWIPAPSVLIVLRRGRHRRLDGEPFGFAGEPRPGNVELGGE